MSKFSNPQNLPYFCVVGRPINHSLSPTIHHAFAKSLNIKLFYDRVEVGPGELASVLNEFPKHHGVGMNVTVPLKEEAASIASELTERAAIAGAANTLILRQQQRIVADNTDGAGLVSDLQHNLQTTINNKNLLVLGAGGAVRGVLAPLIACAPRQIIIANRTIDKALQLVERFDAAADDKQVRLSALSYDELARSKLDGQAMGIVINGTSLGLSGQVPPIPAELITATTLVYDMMYHSSGITAFTAWAEQNGAGKAVDGLGMLVEQAAEAFFLWHGQRPATRPILESLRE